MRVLFICFFLMILSSCSFRSLALKNIDWLMERQIDSLFDLTSEQEKSIEPAIGQFMTMIEGDLGVKAIATIDFIILQSQDGLSQKEINQVLLQVENIRGETMRFMAKPASQLLKTLTKEQWEHYREEQKDKDQDLVEIIESKNFAEKVEEMTEERIEFLNQWYGDLNQAQKTLIKESSSQSKEMLERRLEYRQQGRNFFIRLAQEEPQVGIEKFFLNWADDSGHRAKRMGTKAWNWQERTSKFLFDFHATLTPEQWQHFRNELAKLKGDLRSIARSS